MWNVAWCSLFGAAIYHFTLVQLIWRLGTRRWSPIFKWDALTRLNICSCRFSSLSNCHQGDMPKIWASVYSLSGRTSYRKISWSLETARFSFRLFQALWNLTPMHIGSSAAEMTVKFQSHTIIITSNLAASRVHEIWRWRDFGPTLSSSPLFAMSVGAFLLPYFAFTILCGVPSFYLEVAVGQFTNRSPITVWSVSPIMKGQLCWYGVGLGLGYQNFVVELCSFFWKT